MSVSRETIAKVSNVETDYVCCKNCIYNNGIIVGDVIECSAWQSTLVDHISNKDFCSFWHNKSCKSGGE